MEFTNVSKKPFNTVHANNFEFYQELDGVIQSEPLDVFDPELRGLAGSIGIVKGKPFNPDERMTKILTEAAAVGNATARAIAFRNRDPRAPFFPNSSWKTGFIANDYRWLDGDGMAGRNMDARTYFFYIATVNTPVMAAKMPGKGMQYAANWLDRNGNPYDGAKTYKVNIPANPPQRIFGRLCVRPRHAPSCRPLNPTRARTINATS